MKKLPYITDNHEFFITFEKSTATVVCKFDKGKQDEAFSNPITLEEFKEIMVSATIKGIKNVLFNSNYSIELQRHQWKEIAKKYNVTLTRISN